ncbi:MAG: DedA family protein [Candidatus Neomarinimicrobiota bacterium]|nr:MAG: DedA family protein [Candidatus Neomarinimicrobiota bacterium]
MGIKLRQIRGKKSRNRNHIFFTRPSAVSSAMDLTVLLTTYGYWALFIGILMEGETILVLAAFLARSGYLDLRWVILIAFVGTYLIDQTLFHLGRHNGLPLLTRRPGWQHRVATLDKWLQRNQNLVIVGFRFVYGFRTVTPYMLGAFQIPVKKYLILNGIGGLIWSVAISLLGYFLGVLAERVLEGVRQAQWVGLGLIIVGSLVLMLIHHIHRRRKMVAGATEEAVREEASPD